MSFNKTKTDNYLNKYFRRRKLPCLSVGILLQDERFFFNYGFEDTANYNGETALYEIGSVTKLFVAAVYASLVHQKQIRLQDTIQDLLGNRFSISPQFKNITVHSLLTHTSGLPGLPGEFLAMIGDMSNPYRDFDDSVIIEYLKLSEDIPGKKKYEYSNLGYGILGFILTVKFEKDLFPIIKEIVLDPLKMYHTTILPFASPELLLPGNDTSNRLVPHWEMNSFQGAGCLLSNTTDLTRFLKAHLDGHPSFLSLATQFEAGNRVALGWHKYGFLSRILGFHKYLWHNGMTGGFSGYITMNTSKKIAAVALTNKTDDLTECALGLYGYLGKA